MTRRLAFVVAVVLAGAATGCGDDAPSSPTSPSPSSAAVDLTTRLFTGTLAPGSRAFYSFTVPQDSGVFLTLASVVRSGDRVADAAPIGLGLGVPRGTGCALTTQVITPPDLAAQIREWRREGVHCAAVFDAGALTGEVTFAVRIGYFR